MEHWPDIPRPDINADAKTYWAAADEGRLVLQKCAECGTHRFYPRHLCPACGSDAVTWDDVSGNATVHSFTIVHRAPTPAFRARAPYVIALVELDEGPRMMTNILGDDALETAIGDAVTVVFQERAGGGKVPQFIRRPG